MSSKHTPGPWYVGREDENTGEIEINSDGRPYICLVFPGVIDGVTPANARLIAAAPEMLEALKDLIGWVPGGVHFHTDAPQKAVERASAAIAKATGGAQ